jgi:hypothetical protein
MVSTQDNSNTTCSICGHLDHKLVFTSKILDRYSSDLIECRVCGFRHFSNPFRWLDEAYSSPIANSDTGIVARSLELNRILSAFLSLNCRSGQVLDWGSGSGLLVRLLRDTGHECYGFEPFTQPVLAERYTFRDENRVLALSNLRVIMAIEVVEHLQNPKDFFGKALSLADTLIFSTELIENSKGNNEWWYYSQDTGQHISFFSKETLSRIASINYRHYASMRNNSLHIMAKRSSDIRLLRILTGRLSAQIAVQVAKLARKIHGRTSLTQSDHLEARNALDTSQPNIVL